MARDAVLTERTRIAREMHDAVGHRVSLMVLQAGAIEMAAADPAGSSSSPARCRPPAGRRSTSCARWSACCAAATDDDAPLGPQPGPRRPRRGWSRSAARPG